MKHVKVMTLVLAPLFTPVVAEAQTETYVSIGGAANYTNPEIGVPSRALLLRPEKLEAVAAHEVHEATLTVPEGPIAQTLGRAFENRQALGDVTLSAAGTGERAKYYTVTFKKVMISHVSPSADDGGSTVKIIWTHVAGGTEFQDSWRENY